MLEYNLEQTLLFESDGSIPNSVLPLIIYPRILISNPLKMESTFDNNNWKNSWVGGVYSYHHFHSNTHEVLGVIRGTATIMFGGPHGLYLNVSAGDIVIIPAGVGHKLEKSTSGFAVVGAYPDGMSYDLNTGNPNEHDKYIQNINNVPIPNKDPFFGNKGPLLDIWMD